MLPLCLHKNLLPFMVCFIVVLCDFDPFADKDLFSINWAGPRESGLVVRLSFFFSLEDFLFSIKRDSSMVSALASRARGMARVQ